MGKAARILHRLILIIVITLPIAVFIAAGLFWFVPDRPYGDPEAPNEEIVVNRGATIDTVSLELESRGLVADRRYFSVRFRILSRLGAVAPLQAGRYSLSFGERPSGILGILTSPSGGHRVYTELVIPPGLSSSAISRRIEESGLAHAEDVMDAIVRLSDDYPIIKNPYGLQGYMFPDTYNIETPLSDDGATSRETAELIVGMMADRFFDVLDEVDPTWRDLTVSQLHEKVTLASIVEREYRVDEEASRIASVFTNRLEEGMRLESCATVVFAIEETEAGRPFLDEYIRFNRRIFIRYLDISSPYNTYRNQGLPPGPIAIPGKTALEAAFYPDDGDSLFFVVKDPAAGTHTFTRDYADHLDARESYLNQYVVKD